MVLALLTLGVACTPDSGERWDGTVVREGDVTVVRNPAEPLLTDGSVTAERVWAVPHDSIIAGDADVEWSLVVQIGMLGDTSYALDHTLKRIHVVSPDGEWLRSFGREGGGPGELRMPMSALRLGDDVAVVDIVQQQVQRFTRDGEFLTTVSLGGLPLAPHALDDHSIVLTVMELGGGLVPRWRRVTPDGAITGYEMPGEDSVGTLAEYRARMDSGCVHATARGGRLLRYDCSAPAIHLYDSAGMPTQRIEVPGDTIVRSDEEMDSIARAFGASMARGGLASAEAASVGRASAKAFRTQSRFWGAGRDPETGVYAMWDQRGKQPGTSGAVLHLFSPEGIYLARIRFAEPWRDYAYVPGGIVAASTDEATGLVRLVRYRLALPPEALARASLIARDAGLP